MKTRTLEALRDAYIAVPHAIAEDDRFEKIYGDDARLATWLRLRLAADRAWPAPAMLPPLEPEIVADLVDVELIEIVSNGRYRVPGLDEARAKRIEAARIAGLASGQARQPKPPERLRNEPFPEKGTNRSPTDQRTIGERPVPKNGNLRKRIRRENVLLQFPRPYPRARPQEPFSSSTSARR